MPSILRYTHKKITKQNIRLNQSIRLINNILKFAYFFVFIYVDAYWKSILSKPIKEYH